MNIISFEKLDSTNKYAKQNIENLVDKTIISADVQTNGYGRFERRWVDLGTENIYMTFVLKPSDTLSPVHSNLTQYLSVCLCKQLEEIIAHSMIPLTPTLSPCGRGRIIHPEIKWPNDVLLNGKKVCGILAETVIKGGKLKGIVLGIGVNLNASEKNLNEIDRPATSLNIELGRTVNKQEFMQKLVKNFFKNYDEFLEKGFEFIKDDYENFSLLTSHSSPLKIAVFNHIKEGMFNGFDNNGNLILLMPDGKVENINMGEIV